VLLPIERKSELLWIIRFQPTRSIPWSTSAEIVLTRCTDATGAYRAFVEEWVRITSLWTGRRAFGMAGRVAVGAGSSVKGTIVALVLSALHPNSLGGRGLTSSPGSLWPSPHLGGEESQGWQSVEHCSGVSMSVSMIVGAVMGLGRGMTYI
jgi:hypothetical protein